MTESNSKASAIFEYANEQIIALGLDLRVDERILKTKPGSSKTKQVEPA